MCTLERCRDLGLLKAHGRQRTDSTPVLAAVRALNRLERVRQTLRHGLDVLAVAAPGWLRAQARPQWAEHSRHRSDEGRLPQDKEAQRELADQLGRDGTELLSAISADTTPAWLPQVPAVERLRRLGVQNSRQTDQKVWFRTSEDGFPPSAQFISSPYDLDAHLAKKGSTCWVGSKGALTETGEDEVLNLITHVEMTSAPRADGELTPQVHRALPQQDLLPAIHLVDTGFLDAELLVASVRGGPAGADAQGPTLAIPCGEGLWGGGLRRGLRTTPSDLSRGEGAHRVGAASR